MRESVVNEAGIFNAKKGYYKGKEVTVTHRDPKSGDVFLEDCPRKDGGITVYGIWVSADSVKYMEES